MAPDSLLRASMVAITLVLTGCGIPLTSDDPLPRSSTPNPAPSTSSSTVIATSSTSGGATTTTPALPCQQGDLNNLRIRPDQKGPLTAAYGSKIVKSAAVHTGDGFTIVAALLAHPTGPDGSDRVAWLMRQGDGEGWVVAVSPSWDGSGGPEGHRRISRGPAARAAAIACLG